MSGRSLKINFIRQMRRPVTAPGVFAEAKTSVLGENELGRIYFDYSCVKIRDLMEMM